MKLVKIAAVSMPSLRAMLWRHENTPKSVKQSEGGTCSKLLRHKQTHEEKEVEEKEEGGGGGGGKYEHVSKTGEDSQKIDIENNKVEAQTDLTLPLF